MKKSDLGAMSYKQLAALEAEIQTLKIAKQKEEQDALRAKLAKMAADAGYRLDIVLQATRPAVVRKRVAVPVKYRDPAQPENTWSGRGRPARWLAAYLKQGKKLDAFKVA